MNRMNRMNRNLMAVLAAAGTALAAQAQQRSSSTTITSDGGQTSTVVSQIIDGVEHRVELKNGEIVGASIDGLDVDHRRDGDTVILLDGGNEVEMTLPREFNTFAWSRWADEIGVRGLEGFQLDRLGPGELRPGFAVEPPKTMVGLSQVGVDGQLRAHLGLGDDEGMMIRSIVGGLPADEAGLKVGDVLIEIDGEPVEGARTLSAALAEREPGDVLGVVVLRKGSPVSVEIEVAAYDPTKLNAFVFPGERELRMGLDPDDLARLPGVNDNVFEELRAARERARAARDQAMQRNRELELLIRPEGGERAIIIERERGTIEQADKIRRERDELFDTAIDIIERLREIEDRADIAELAEQLGAITDRAAELHRTYEPLRRDTERDWHPRFEEADELRQVRDELRGQIRSLARQLVRAEDAEDIRGILEELGELADHSRVVHREFESLRRLTQRAPEAVEREARGALRSVDERIDELESKLDRLIEALERDNDDDD